MKFDSTNRGAAPVSARTAVLAGLAPDGGLFMPLEIPSLPSGFIAPGAQRTFAEVAFEAARLFLGAEVPDAVLLSIAEELEQIRPRLRRLSGTVSVLELFHGPTFAFKDYGARFMARLMSFFNKGSDRELRILVATSGDTGSAVAHGFYLVPGIKVVVLYPSGKISALQEKQLTTLGGNITALEVAGCFDDCQRLVKEAFQDKELADAGRLSSANSINIARLIPQAFYYIYAASLAAAAETAAAPLVFSVPSGNFGNLTAGLFAKRMGLPAARFIAATNANSAVVEYLETGRFLPRPSVTTISNAMDVGNPSNFARLLALYDGDHRRIQEDICGQSFTDDQTRAAIAAIYADFAYAMDPHGAVGWLGWKNCGSSLPHRAHGIVCETAHPAKFIDIMESVIPGAVQLPAALEAVLHKEKLALKLGTDFREFKEYLLETR